jgi:hypothetical protein
LGYSALAVDHQNYVYLANRAPGKDNVTKYSPQGKEITSWDGSDSGVGRMRQPTGIAVGPDSRIYVTAAYHLYVFDTKGNTIVTRRASGGTGGSKPWPLGSSDHVAVDPRGALYLTAFNDDKVRKLSPDGKLQQVWNVRSPSDIALDTKGAAYVPTSNGLLRISPSGKVGRFGPANPDVGSVAVGPGNTVWADGALPRHTHPQVLKLAPTGKLLSAWG